MIKSFGRETKVKMQVISADSDYVAARLLFMVGILPSAGRLANHVIESLTKAFLWSIDRDDLIDKIIGWGGNSSHNALKILQLIHKEKLIENVDTLINRHKTVLESFYSLYQMRFMDIFEKGQPKLYADVGVLDVETMDEIVSVLRNAIVLIPSLWNETPITNILKGKSGNLGKGENEYLTRNNNYLKELSKLT